MVLSLHRLPTPHRKAKRNARSKIGLNASAFNSGFNSGFNSSARENA
jgi:hypothetical protein